MNGIKLGEMGCRFSVRPVASQNVDWAKHLSVDVGGNSDFDEVIEEYRALTDAQKFVEDVLANHADRASRIEALAWRLANEVKKDSENEGVVGLYLAKHLLNLLSTKDENTATVKDEPVADDPVNHPRHYTNHPSGVEAIEITRHHNFAIGNAIKYLWRAGLKDENTTIQDLEKAKWYIDDEIKRLTDSNKSGQQTGNGGK